MSMLWTFYVRSTGPETKGTSNRKLPNSHSLKAQAPFNAIQELWVRCTTFPSHTAPAHLSW